jgi:hypothetical protein
MIRAGKAARMLFGAAIAAFALASYAGPQVSVYRWDVPNGPSNVDGFSQWLGTPVTIAGAYEAKGTWDDIDGQDWQLSPWSKWVRAKSGRNLALGVPLIPDTGGSLASCAAGQYDVYWRNLANKLAYYGLHWAYLRLGWEMNGGWFKWGAPSGSGKEASFAGCFRRVVQVMRQAQPANQWKFVWNPGFDGWNTATYYESVWPGDSYVDVVGVDMYDQSWAANTYPYPSPCDSSCRLTRQQNAWNYYTPQLNTLRNFAAKHGKPMAWPEWGVITRYDGHGGGDNTYFMQKMRDFIMDPATNTVFHTYFDVSSNGSLDHRITDSIDHDNPTGATRMPNAAALYKKLFGPQSTSTSTSATFSAPASGATLSGSYSDSSRCEVTGTGISRVVFYLDTTQLNTESYGPWQCQLDTRKFANGSHTLRAVVYNSSGASTTITRTVNILNVAFSAPTSGATISGSFSNSTGCQVNGSAVTRVVFSMDTTALNTETYSPWQCKLDTRKFANGTHTLRATAYNSAGGSTTTAVTVTVKN